MRTRARYLLAFVVLAAAGAFPASAPADVYELWLDHQTLALTDGVNSGLWGIQNGSLLICQGTTLTNLSTIRIGLYTGGWGWSTLRFDDPVLFTGAGDTDLSGAYITTAAGVTFTNDAGHLIHGYSGRIQASMHNAGIIQADSASGALWIESAAKTSTGILRASAGGTLHIQTTVDQTGGGQVVADNGTVNLAGAHLLGGTTATSGSGKIWSDNAANTITDLANTGNWGVQNGSLLVCRGTTLTNDGTIEIGLYTGGSGWSTLRFEDPVVLGGTGVIACSGTNITTAPGVVLTQAADHAIRGGAANIDAALTNHGTITADWASHTTALRGEAKTNTGAFQALGGAYLDISTAVTQNATGQILADGAGSQVRLKNGAAITGGTLVTAGGGVFEVSGGGTTATLTDLTNLGTVNARDGATVAVTGTTLTNDGQLALYYGGMHGGAHLRFDSTVLLTGAGEVYISNGDIATAGGATLTHAAGHTIRGGNGSLPAALINDGVIRANVAGQALGLTSNAKTNHHLMEAIGGGYLDIRTAVNQGPAGRIAADGATSQVRLYNGAAITGGTLATTGGAVFEVGGGGTTVTLTDLTNLGTVNARDGATVAVTGTTLTNDGQLALYYGGMHGGAHLRINSNVLLDGTGEVYISTGDIGTTTGSSLINGPDHHIRGQGNVNLALDNRGTVEASGGTLNLNGAITQYAAGTLTGGAWVASNCSLNVAAIGNVTTNQGRVTLSGPGAGFAKINSLLDNQGAFSLLAGKGFTTAAALANSGSVSVGAGSGLTVNGTYTQTAGTTLVDGTFRANSAVADILGGTFTLNTDAAAGGPLTLNVNGPGAAAVFGATQHLTGLNLATGLGRMTPSGSRALVTQTLAIDVADSVLDLADNNLVLDYLPAAANPAQQVVAWVRTGYQAGAGGPWTGNGITSSAAAANDLTALGILDNTDAWVGGKTNLEGVAVDTTAVLVKYTYWGDANFDGRVTLDDYDVIDYYYWFPPAAGTCGWWTGDFDYDGDVDFDDYDRIDYAYWFQGGPLGGTEGVGAPLHGVPEPATLALVAAGALAGLARSRAARRAGRPPRR